MSHFVTVETQLKDIVALKAACRELGLDVQENAEARGYAPTGSTANSSSPSKVRTTSP